MAQLADGITIINDMLNHIAYHIICLNGLIMKLASVRREESDTGLNLYDCMPKQNTKQNAYLIVVLTQTLTS
jgi:hypothetical protein